jgi:hypothetical protein
MAALMHAGAEDNEKGLRPDETTFATLLRADECKKVNVENSRAKKSRFAMA